MLDGNACLLSSGENSPFQATRRLLHLFPAVITPNKIKCRDPGAHRQWITRERPGLVHGPQGRDQLHDLPFAAIRADWETAADHFAQSCQIGLDAIESLRAAFVDAEACHHFIKDQDSAFTLGNTSKTVPQSGLRWDNPHIPCHRLDNYPSDLTGVIFEQHFH